jgi:(1->4)-alpha-D-glucan 1-alpha-D-glucosylmutase
MRHLLQLRNELSEVFTAGSYEPLEVSGPHRDHVIAFARRRGRDAAITVVARWFAPFSEGGRIWPRAEAFDGAIHADGFSVDGSSGRIGAAAIPLSSLFRPVPAAVLKARFIGTARPVTKGRKQFA